MEFPSIITSYSNAQVPLETEDYKIDDIVDGMDNLSLRDNEELAFEEETKKHNNNQYIDKHRLGHFQEGKMILSQQIVN